MREMWRQTRGAQGRKAKALGQGLTGHPSGWPSMLIYRRPLVNDFEQTLQNLRSARKRVPVRPVATTTASLRRFRPSGRAARVEPPWRAQNELPRRTFPFDVVCEAADQATHGVSRGDLLHPADSTWLPSNRGRSLQPASAPPAAASRGRGGGSGFWKPAPPAPPGGKRRGVGGKRLPLARPSDPNPRGRPPLPAGEPLPNVRAERERKRKASLIGWPPRCLERRVGRPHRSVSNPSRQTSPLRSSSRRCAPARRT